MKTVTVRLGRGFRTTVDTASHQFFADEPPDEGGEDAGPNPYDLLLASLGACTAMTLRLYADGKSWSLDSVRITLRHDRTHVKDCTDCAEDHRGAHVDHIERIVHLTGDLDPSQRERLLEIAERCPVARTLENGPRIRSRLE
jgi:putative redox protein